MPAIHLLLHAASLLRPLPPSLSCRTGRWAAIYKSQAEQGIEIITTTPEFGPAAYCPIDPKTDQPIADVRDVSS